MGFIFPIGVPFGYFALLWQQRLTLDPGQGHLVGNLTARRIDKDEMVWEYMHGDDEFMKKYVASERSERAVQTPVGATTYQIRIARFEIGRRRVA